LFKEKLGGMGIKGKAERKIIPIGVGFVRSNP
jgi:hypothetical protein